MGESKFELITKLEQDGLGRYSSTNKIIEKLDYFKKCILVHKRLEELLSFMLPSGTQRLSSMPRSSSGSYEPERWADKRIEADNRLKVIIKRIEDNRNEWERIAQTLEDGNDKHRKVLELRYFGIMTNADIAEKLDCSKKYVERLHRDAVERLARKQ